MPAHVGAETLKKICFVTLRPLFLEWSRGYALELGDVTLRLKKNWLELVPATQGHDVDAIWNEFFVEKKNGIKRFTPGNGLDLILSIPFTLYQSALAQSLSEDVSEVGRLTLLIIMC